MFTVQFESVIQDVVCFQLFIIESLTLPCQFLFKHAMHNALPSLLSDALKFNADNGLLTCQGKYVNTKMSFWLHRE